MKTAFGPGKLSLSAAPIALIAALSSQVPPRPGFARLWILAGKAYNLAEIAETDRRGGLSWSFLSRGARPVRLTGRTL
jgi:hypothetical protein